MPHKTYKQCNNFSTSLVAQTNKYFSIFNSKSIVIVYAKNVFQIKNSTTKNVNFIPLSKKNNTKNECEILFAPKKCKSLIIKSSY